MFRPEIDASRDDGGKGVTVVATDVDGNEISIAGYIRDLQGGAFVCVIAAASEEGKVLGLVILKELVAVCARVPRTRPGSTICASAVWADTGAIA